MSDENLAEQREPNLCRVVFAGGGTGGHVYMAVSIREELERRGQAVCLFVGTLRGLEMKILPPLNFPLETIRIGGIQNLSLKKKLIALLQLPGSVWRSLQILHSFRPQVVVGLGGYSAGPVVVAARCRRFPCVVIEPNVVPGLTNRLLARWVQGAAVAFQETLSAFPTKVRLTGIPIRQGFHKVDPSAASAAPLRVLIFGGSRGSRPLNQIICAALPDLAGRSIEICHQTGEEDVGWVRDAYSTAHFTSDVHPYLEDMPQRFSWADLIVSRAGASTVAEITAAGRASILIPFPRAADDHQTRNALALADRGASLLLPQAGLDGARLARTILDLNADRLRLEQMAQCSRSLAIPDSSRQIVDLLKEVAFP